MASNTLALVALFGIGVLVLWLLQRGRTKDRGTSSSDGGYSGDYGGDQACDSAAGDCGGDGGGGGD